MTPADNRTVEGLLRTLVPQALGIVARRYGNFADTEDAVQAALIAAARTWPETGIPDRPLAWLARAAGRNLAGQHRSDQARRRREVLAASWSLDPPDAAPSRDDTLTVLLMCSHPRLTPTAAIPLTLRAVGGLTTREIAAAFLVPEPTMAQRISRAKATIRAAGEPFALPDPEQLPARLANVLHVLYLVFTEGHTATEGTNLDRPDLACEAIRITGLLHDTRPDHPEVAGLLALMLLSDARRPARTDAHGRLVPLDQQDRTRWDHDKIRAGTTLITGALQRHQPGPYQLQAAIAAIHDRATSYAETDWEEILAVYDVLARLTPSPSITLNHAIATAMAHGPRRGLALLDEAADAIGDHHRYHATLAHLHELAGDHRAALSSYERAIALATNQPERDHLRTRAALLCAAGSPATTR